MKLLAGISRFGYRVIEILSQSDILSLKERKKQTGRKKGWNRATKKDTVLVNNFTSDREFCMYLVFKK